MGVHLLHRDIGRPRRRPASESDGQLQLRRGLGVDHRDVALPYVPVVAGVPSVGSERIGQGLENTNHEALVAAIQICRSPGLWTLDVLVRVATRSVAKIDVGDADLALDRILKMALRSGVSPGYNNENIPWINVRHSILRVPNPRAAGSSRKLTSVCSRSEPSVIVTPK